MKDNTIYTIGYAAMSIPEFIEKLKEYNIACVIDVRSSPYSAFKSEFNRGALNETLKANGIYYRNYSEEFGARQENTDLYPNGYLDFEMFSQTDAFKNGIKTVIGAMNEEFTFALMCAEKDPITCHRTILVSRAFHEAGVRVIHIENDGKTETQEDIEERLLEMYFPDRDQTSLFGDLRSENDLIQEAYREQNKKIGYKMEDT